LFSLSITSTLVDFLDKKPCVSGVVNILKHTYKIEIHSASFYLTLAMRERIVKKWEDIKIILV
jgi:hypothetical protein